VVRRACRNATHQTRKHQRKAASAPAITPQTARKPARRAQSEGISQKFVAPGEYPCPARSVFGRYGIVVLACPHPEPKEAKMAEIRITNCHVHSFTARHVPRFFPHPAVYPFKRVPGLVRAAAFGARLLGQHPLADTLDRLHRFQAESAQRSQADVLNRLIPQYPGNTRFVVLPMEMRPTAPGRIEADLRAQHDELADLARQPEFAGRIVPFATIFPDHPGAADEVRRCIEELGFRGLKLYPRLGFAPDHPVLMEHVYPLLAERGLPVMSHCSRGGVSGRGVTPARATSVSDPAAFIPVMRAFPGLRVCLAHFGGMDDWRAYVQDGIDPRDERARRGNWQVAIRDMIGSGEFPNLWTDISYTLFRFGDFVPFLRIFLRDDRIAARVLFGSDYYMTRQEALSERAVCFRLRDALGEEMFRRIAETNPEIWLGERPEAAPAA
jgi:predicted TIM-barrel fold metal-dependent hydrolase